MGWAWDCPSAVPLWKRMEENWMQENPDRGATFYFTLPILVKENA